MLIGNNLPESTFTDLNYPKNLRLLELTVYFLNSDLFV